MLNVVMLVSHFIYCNVSVIMLSVVMLNVIMLSVVAPSQSKLQRFLFNLETRTQAVDFTSRSNVIRQIVIRQNVVAPSKTDLRRFRNKRPSRDGACSR